MRRRQGWPGWWRRARRSGLALALASLLAVWPGPPGMATDLAPPGDHPAPSPGREARDGGFDRPHRPGLARLLADHGLSGERADRFAIRARSLLRIAAERHLDRRYWRGGRAPCGHPWLSLAGAILAGKPIFRTRSAIGPGTRPEALWRQLSARLRIAGAGIAAEDSLTAVPETFCPWKRRHPDAFELVAAVADLLALVAAREARGAQDTDAIAFAVLYALDVYQAFFLAPGTTPHYAAAHTGPNNRRAYARRTDQPQRIAMLWTTRPEGEAMPRWARAIVVGHEIAHLLGAPRHGRCAPSVEAQLPRDLKRSLCDRARDCRIRPRAEIAGRSVDRILIGGAYACDFRFAAMVLETPTISRRTKRRLIRYMERRSYHVHPRTRPLARFRRLACDLTRKC